MNISILWEVQIHYTTAFYYSTTNHRSVGIKVSKRLALTYIIFEIAIDDLGAFIVRSIVILLTTQLIVRAILVRFTSIAIALIKAILCLEYFLLEITWSSDKNCLAGRPSSRPSSNIVTEGRYLHLIIMDMKRVTLASKSLQ